MYISPKRPIRTNSHFQYCLYWKVEWRKIVSNTTEQATSLVTEDYTDIHESQELTELTCDVSNRAKSWEILHSTVAEW